MTWTITTVASIEESITIPFCSFTCADRFADATGIGAPIVKCAGEFVDECGECKGPALPDATDEVITTEEAARRLRARYTPGIKEEVKLN